MIRTDDIASELLGAQRQARADQEQRDQVAAARLAEPVRKRGRSRAGVENPDGPNTGYTLSDTISGVPRPKPPKPPPRTMVAMRIPPNQLAEIDRLAGQRDMNRSEYMIAAALGELTDPGDVTLAEQLEDLERRFTRLEQLAFGET